MTKEEEEIWNLVHEWCNNQSSEIPDFNRRVLMERILALRQTDVVKKSEQLTCDYCENTKPLRYCQDCWENLEQFKQCY